MRKSGKWAPTDSSVRRRLQRQGYLGQQVSQAGSGLPTFPALDCTSAMTGGEGLAERHSLLHGLNTRAIKSLSTVLNSIVYDILTTPIKEAEEGERVVNFGVFQTSELVKFKGTVTITHLFIQEITTKKINRMCSHGVTKRHT
jgi:hypothetical protein